MRRVDIENISLIYEEVSNNVLVVYEVQNEETAKIVYVKEFYVPEVKINSLITYLKKELSNINYKFKLDENNPDGYKEYSAINRKEDMYYIHKFTFISGDIEGIKKEYFIGIDAAKNLYIPLSSSELNEIPILKFIKDANFDKEKTWPIL